MEQSWQIMLVVFLLAICSLLSVGNTRSLASLKHKIMKRSLYEETCPPPYIIEVTEQCNDSCRGDDYCVGNKMCCYDGCSYVCMDPVPSEPVVDWNEDDSVPQFKVEELEVVTPVVEELGCFYHDMLLTNGEKKPFDCRECTCFNGNLMCDVSKCNKDYQARRSFHVSGSGDDNDDDDDDGDNDIRGKGSGNSFFPVVDGVEQKEDFIPFRELEETKAFDSKGRFTTLGPEISGGGGDTSGGEGVKQKPRFISIEEHENQQREDKERKGLEQFLGPEINGSESSGGKGVKQKEDFIPIEEFENEEAEAFDSKGRVTTFGPEISGGESSGEEDEVSGSDRDNLIPIDEERTTEQSGDNKVSLARL
ncbi:uncharacterized protein LOC111332789 isoform X2 [Stylophora pistillata]|uniref:uncharacterized protein LOC111332789 isoform X2 n=1 Tax=Stylophora pistillata TaxID=50429 RepID=UPI000C04EBD5|nr:uncharacterized protein LOC111332789 isoform X2 [Stylophora pistillata]